MPKNTDYTKFTTQELLDFVTKEDGRTVEAKIINGQIHVTHFIYWDSHRKQFNDEGCDGESRWVSAKRFRQEYSNTNWYVDLDDHEAQKDEMDDNVPVIGYVVFVISDGICSYTHFNLLTEKEAVERGLQLVRDVYESNMDSFPDWEETEKEELARRETAVRELCSVDLTDDDDLVIMPLKQLSWQ